MACPVHFVADFGPRTTTLALEVGSDVPADALCQKYNGKASLFTELLPPEGELLLHRTNPTLLIDSLRNEEDPRL